MKKRNNCWSLNAMWYPRPYWFLIPTFELSVFKKDYPVSMAAWTLDFRWLRLMVTLAKFKK